MLLQLPHDAGEFGFVGANLLQGQTVQFMREHQPVSGLMNVVLRHPLGPVVAGFVVGGGDANLGRIFLAGTVQVQYHLIDGQPRVVYVIDDQQ